MVDFVGAGLAECCRLLYDLLRPRAGKQSAIRRSSPSKNLIPVNIRRIVAEAVFVERGVNLFGQPQWIVAVIFDTGQSIAFGPVSTAFWATHGRVIVIAAARR